MRLGCVEEAVPQFCLLLTFKRHPAALCSQSLTLDFLKICAWSKVFLASTPTTLFLLFNRGEKKLLSSNGAFGDSYAPGARFSIPFLFAQSLRAERTRRGWLVS
jgi:hypothetical protein